MRWDHNMLEQLRPIAGLLKRVFRERATILWTFLNP